MRVFLDQGSSTEDLLQLRPGFVAQVFGGVDVSEDGFLAAVDFLILDGKLDSGGIDPVRPSDVPTAAAGTRVGDHYGCLLRLATACSSRQNRECPIRS